MFVRKSFLLASIALVGVSVATAQQVGVSSLPTTSPDQQFNDPFAAPPPAAPPTPDAFAAPPSMTPAMMQAQAERLAFGSATSLRPAPGIGQAPGAVVAAVTPSPDFYQVPSLAPAAAPVAAPAPAGFQIGTPAPAPAPAAPAANPFAAPAAPVAASAPVAPSGTPAAAFSIAPQPAGAGADKGRSPTDETALRYYAGQRDLVRVGAEIRRLKTLYPDWQAPSDLFAPRGGADEQPLWDLYAKGDFTAVRREIEAIKAAKPNWTPSLDLSTKLDDGDARRQIGSAAASGNWAAAIAAAQARPGLLVCGNMDVLWSVGEGFARSGNMARAFDLYAYILSHCDVPQERLATFQKASALLPPNGIEALVSYGRVLPTGQPEFGGLRFDPLRKQMADVASGKTKQLPPAEDLQKYADYVRSSRSASDMGLVGWYFFGQENWDRAAEWFRAGMEAGDDPKLVEGYVLSLRNADRIDEAEALAYKSYSRSQELTKIYVEMVSDELTADEGGKTIDPDVIERFEAVVKDAKSALGAQSIGWHLVAGKDFDGAKDWFARSVEWEPTEEGVVGLAVAATRLQQKSELKQIKARYQEAFPVLADFKDYVPNTVSKSTATRQASAGNRRHTAKTGTGPRKAGGGDRLMAEANKRFENGDYEGALETLDKREARQGKEYGAEILRGWANHKLKRWDTAQAVFEAQDKKRSTKDTRFGIGATSNSRYGMWSDSENKCRKWRKC